MHIDDLLHRLAVRKANVMEEAAAEKGVRQLLLVVGGDDDDRTMPSTNGTPRLVDIELHAIEFEEQIVGEFDICLVDLVDQKHRGLGGFERLPQLARHDIVRDVVHPLVPELAVAKPGDGVVFVESLLRLSRRFNMPSDQVLADPTRDLMGQNSFAGTGLAFDEERALECDRGVDRDAQILRRYVTVRALETLPRHIPRAWIVSLPA